ncbi:uncharacterized protein At2g39795, mitochondrial [Lolium perenne]|uniref:uncharacterized protein At2g39795, mitochondrial n=1 Tax=Lolium perenne TaxID=4522 RepID=UPI0021EA9457|nr:uncharacterized protein At2g39795, mitochondrial-like [Lolium perenne]
MALHATRRAAALLRPAAAPLLRPTPASAARFSSKAEYKAFVACLRDISASAQADKNYSGDSVRDKVDSVRAATHDGEILRVIDNVIRSQHRGLVEENSSDFPFEISEKAGLTELTLTRSLKGEKIEVLVSMPKLDQDGKGDEGLLSSSKENQECEGNTPPEKYSLPVRVTVSKGDGSGLVFTCTANPDDIVIESLSMRRKSLGADEGDAVTYDEGPDFHELDKNLQETFHKYLELRGITPTATKLLHEYMISKDRRVLPKTASKDKRNNLVFLTKLCSFLKKD